MLPTPLATFTPGPTRTPRPLGGVATATPVPKHTGLVGQAPSWAKTVVVGALFAGVVAALAAAYYRRLYAEWRARVGSLLSQYGKGGGGGGPISVSPWTVVKTTAVGIGLAALFYHAYTSSSPPRSSSSEAWWCAYARTLDFGFFGAIAKAS